MLTIQDFVDLQVRVSQGLVTGSTPGLIFERQGTTAGVFQHEGQVTVAFKGTDSAEEWIHTNFKTDKVCFRYAPGRVHEGFLHASFGKDDQIYDALCEKIAQFEPNRINFSGHSLGGALAQLWAHRWALQHPGTPVNNVVTFGSPKLGDATWAASYRRRLDRMSVRCINGRDIVPLVPWWGWHHGASRVLWSDNWMDYAIAKIPFGIRWLRRWGRKTKAISDHPIEFYNRRTWCTQDSIPT